MELGKSVTKLNRTTSDVSHFEGLNKLNMDPEARAKAGYSGGPQQRNPQKSGQLSWFDGAIVQVSKVKHQANQCHSLSFIIC